SRQYPRVLRSIRIFQVVDRCRQLPTLLLFQALQPLLSRGPILCARTRNPRTEQSVSSNQCQASSSNPCGAERERPARNVANQFHSERDECVHVDSQSNGRDLQPPFPNSRLRLSAARSQTFGAQAQSYSHGTN